MTEEDAAKPPEEPDANESEKAAEAPAQDADEPEDDNDLHPLQKLLDNPWALLFLGFVIPTLSYTAWGWIELLLMTEAKLP